MESNNEKLKTAVHFPGKEGGVQDLLDRLSLLEDRFEKIVCELGKFTEDVGEPAIEPRFPSNIIQFPVKNHIPNEFKQLYSMDFSRNQSKPHSLIPFLAIPGKQLPSWIPDYRSVLQRDGLILIAWDKRCNEIGERYSAYWVTSNGIPRYYASKPLPGNDFFSASPNHKSYAAEDGIEFHGQAAPAYIVHVAPELMMSNPKHGELRLAHIKTLKEHGYKADFDYKYLLKTDKSRSLPHSKIKGHPDHKARA